MGAQKTVSKARKLGYSWAKAARKEEITAMREENFEDYLYLLLYAIKPPIVII
jgi:uncharacterized protein YdaT